MIGGLLEHQGASDFVATIKNKSGTEFQKRFLSCNIWDNIIITVSCKLNGLTYTLPSYIVYSDARQAKATKLELRTSATYLGNSTGIIQVNVNGAQGVTFTKIECTGKAANFKNSNFKITT
jgi:hypothetical protein